MKLKKLLIITFIAVFFLVSFNLTAASKRPFETFKYPPLNPIKKAEVIKDATANGIKLRLIKEDKLPLITLFIIMKGGSAFDPQDKVSLSSITSQMLRIGGTEKMKPEELEKFLDSNGINFNFMSDTDSNIIILSCLKDKLDSGLEVLAQMLMTPSFDKEKLEEIKTQSASGISRRNDDPGDILTREFKTLMYGKDSPLASVLEYEHLDKITRNDVIKCYKEFYAPSNMLVGISGPIEMADLKGMFEKYLGAWDHKINLPEFPKVTEPKYDFKVAFVDKSDLNQSYVSMGHLGIMKDPKKTAKINIFNSIFSGGKGMSNRLFNRIRTDMGATYSIRGGVGTSNNYPGTTSFRTFTKSESTAATVKAIFEEIKRIQTEKVSPKELEEAKNAYLNSYVFEFKSPFKILADSVTREFNGEPEDAVEKMIEDVKNVTAEDVMEVAKSYLHSDKMVVTIVGNGKELQEQLTTMGKVEKLDITIKQPKPKEVIPEATPESLKKGKDLLTALLNGKYKGYKKIKSTYQEYDMVQSMQGQSMTLGFKTTTLFPDKFYNELSVMGMTMKMVVNGDKGYMDRMGQTSPMPMDAVKKQQFSSLYNVFTYMDKYQVQYLAEKEINGNLYDVLYLSEAEMGWFKLYINKKTNLIEMDEKMGQTGGIVLTTQSDFKTIDGIPFAFKHVSTLDGKEVLSITVKKITVNEKVDQSLFEIK